MRHDALPFSWHRKRCGERPSVRFRCTKDSIASRRRTRCPGRGCMDRSLGRHASAIVRRA
ncbi:hypothetical protein K788_0001259 (plasmid) [Paraburkholderia caribensis MBA4]|uniref:Uncharacterized protein n=1 Tax=Paraburkholderia caribensis MBA4 TaxID=1323664 RepID=A0A0P0RNA0_9BURK|nr:hypothetical protein K788_0001259 [Paraburkholderia caribensis MBA4]